MTGREEIAREEAAARRQVSIDTARQCLDAYQQDPEWDNGPQHAARLAACVQILLSALDDATPGTTG